MDVKERKVKEQSKQPKDSKKQLSIKSNKKDSEVVWKIKTDWFIRDGIHRHLKEDLSFRAETDRSRRFSRFK